MIIFRLIIFFQYFQFKNFDFQRFTVLRGKISPYFVSAEGKSRSTVSVRNILTYTSHWRHNPCDLLKLRFSFKIMMLNARVSRNLRVAGWLSRPLRFCAFSSWPSRTAASDRASCLSRNVGFSFSTRHMSSVVDLSHSAAVSVSEVVVAPTNWSLLSSNCRENAEQRAIGFAVHMSGCASKQEGDILRLPRNDALQEASQAATRLAQELRYESRRLQAHPGMNISAPDSVLRNLLEEVELWFECASALQGWPTPSGSTGLMSSLQSHSAAQKQLQAQLQSSGSELDAHRDAAVLSDAGQRSLLLLPTVSHMPIWGLEEGFHNVLEPQIASLAMAVAERLGAASAPEQRSGGRASYHSPLLRPVPDSSLLSSAGLLRLLAPLARSVTLLLSAPPKARVTEAERKGAHAALAFLIESDSTIRSWATTPRAATTAAAADADAATAAGSAADGDVDVLLEQGPLGRLAAVVDMLWYLGGPSAGGSRWDAEALAASLRWLVGAAIAAIDDGALTIVKQRFGSHAAAFVAETVLSLHRRQGMRATALFAAVVPTLEEEARLLEASLVGSRSGRSTGSIRVESGVNSEALPADGSLVVYSASTAPSSSPHGDADTAAARLGSDIHALSRAARLFSACVALRNLDCDCPSLARSALKVSLHLLRRLPAPPPLPHDVAAAAAGQRHSGSGYDDGSNEAQEEAENAERAAAAAASQHATASAIHGEALRLFTGTFAEALLTRALSNRRGDAYAGCSFSEALRMVATSGGSTSDRVTKGSVGAETGAPSLSKIGAKASGAVATLDGAMSIDSCLRTLGAEAREQLILHFRALESVARVWRAPGQRSRSRRRGGSRGGGADGQDLDQEPAGSSLLRLLSAEPTNRAMYRLATMSWASLQLARDGRPDAAVLGVDAAAPVCELLYPLLQLACSEIMEAQAAAAAGAGVLDQDNDATAFGGSGGSNGGYADVVSITEVLDRVRLGQRTESNAVQDVLRATGTLHSFYLYAVGAGLLSAEQQVSKAGELRPADGAGSDSVTALPSAADLQAIKANLAPGWELPGDWMGRRSADGAAAAVALQSAEGPGLGLQGYYSGQLFPAWLARVVLAARAWEVANKGVWQPARHFGRRQPADASNQPNIFETAAAASADGPTTPMQQALVQMMSRFCDENGFPQPLLNHYEPSLGVQIPIAWPEERIAVIPIEAWRYERTPLHGLLLVEARRARRPTDFVARGLPRSLPLTAAGTGLPLLHVREAVGAADAAAKQAVAEVVPPALLSRPPPGSVNAGKFGGKASRALVNTVKEGGSECLAGSPWDGPLLAAVALRVAALRASGWYVVTLSRACASFTADGRWDKADGAATARGHLYRQGLWEVMHERTPPEARAARLRKRSEARFRAAAAAHAAAEPSPNAVSVRGLAPQQQLQRSVAAAPPTRAPAPGQKQPAPRPPTRAMTPIGLSLKLKAPLPTLQPKPRELADPDSSWYM